MVISVRYMVQCIYLLLILIYTPWFILSFRPSLTGKNLRTEPKYITFLSQLLLLFKFCHVCKSDNPTLETRQIGTTAVITTTCINPRCKNVSTCNTQPMMPNSKILAGNFLLCMTILVAGSSATKLLRIFSNMGLACISEYIF